MKRTVGILATALVAVLTATSSNAAVIFQDSFTYPDGSITNVSGGIWSYHNSQATELNVASGQAVVLGANASDASASLAGAPYPSTSATAALYAKFTFNVTNTPTAAGAYFIHFRDGGTGFRARVYVSTTGAGSGYRVGIANAGGSVPSTNVPTDLTLNTTYTAVIRYVLATGRSTLWLSPANETSSSVTAVDTPSTGNAMSFISLRQNSGLGGVLVDDLVVGTTFADVIPSSAGSNPPFITIQPVGGNVSAGTSFTFTNVSGGDEPLTYAWQKNGAALGAPNSPTYNIPSLVVGDSGDYTVVVANASGSVTSSVATLTVSAVAQPPVITNQPASTNVAYGSSATFNVGVTGTEPLSYEWRFHGTNIGGSAAFYTVNNVGPNNSGPYTVVITNVAGAVTSSPAILTAVPPPLTNIAYLHTLIDTNFNASNTVTLFTVEGLVITHQNLTPAPNALFYLQDTSAGIACFWGGNSTNLPPVGTRVRVTAPLTSFNGLLELTPSAANPLHSVTALSSNNPLPTPVAVPFDAATQSNPAIMDALEGSYVVASNVFIELTTPTFAGTCLLTNNLGETFTLFANASTDIPGQTKPLGPVTIYGVLGQFDPSNPRDTGYQLIPSRFDDIVSQAKAATVRFTNHLSQLIRPGQPTPNTIADGVLRLGEKLTMTVNVTDPDDGNVTITPLTAGLPGSAFWTTGATTGTNVNATFTFQPVPGDAGVNYTIALRAANAFTTTTNRWNIYVPTAVEQMVFITEFLANPTSNTNLPHFNPLHRTEIPASVTVMDEYIEIANQSGSDVDLYDWSVADAVGVRHRFYSGGSLETLSSSNAIIVYGGPANSALPNLPASVLSFPASEGTAGLALNNTGSETITLRNGTNVIDRVQYFGTSVSSQGSLARFPTLNSDFVPSAFVGTNTSAGTQYEGSGWTSPVSLPDGVSPITLTYGNPVVLNYAATLGNYYTLWQADEVNELFKVVNGGLSTNATGVFSISNAPLDRQFYFITTP